MKFALIDRGKVSQISSEKFPIAKPFFWVECDGSTEENFLYDNKSKKFINPENNISIQEKIQSTKSRALSLLKTTAWTQIEFSVTPDKKLEWRDYRKKIYDIYLSEEPSPIWPKPPTI